MSDPNTVIYADAFGEDALLDEGLPLAERRQALVALHRLLHGAAVADAVHGLPLVTIAVIPSGALYVATRQELDAPGCARHDEGCTPEEALARALAVWISRLTLVIAERRIARAIELGRLAATVAVTVKGAKAEGGHLKRLGEDES